MLELIAIVGIIAVLAVQIAQTIAIKRALSMDKISEGMGELLDNLINNVTSDKETLEKLAILGAAVGAGVKSQIPMLSGGKGGKPKLTDIILGLITNKLGPMIGVESEQQPSNRPPPSTM